MTELANSIILCAFVRQQILTQNFYILKDSLVTARGFVEEIRELFRTNQNRLKIMVGPGSNFFQMCQYAFIRTAVVELCRITDSKQTNKNTLSFESMLNDIYNESEVDYNEIQRLLTELKAEMTPIRTFRNKRLSHNDLRTLAETLALSLEHFDNVFPLMDNILNRLARRIVPKTTFITKPIMNRTGNGRSVLIDLEWGKRAKENYMATRNILEPSLLSEILRYVDGKPAKQKLEPAVEGEGSQ